MQHIINQNHKPQRWLEVCAGDIDSVIAAAAGGARRVELCSALAEGGLTPSAALIKAAVEKAGDKMQVNVLIRPRPGDFIYDEHEATIMIDDIVRAAEAGADGVVIGALTADGHLDLPLITRMVKAAANISITFHRAFDLCREPIEAANALADMGINRLLTSGQAPSAIQGVELLKQLTEKTRGRLSVMPGGGVNAANAAEILDRSGATEIHASARHAVKSLMTFRRSDVSMGTPGTDEYTRLTTSPEIVREIVNAINA